MGDHFGECAGRIAGEAAVEIFSVDRGETRRSLRGGHVEHWYENDATSDFLEF